MAWRVRGCAHLLSDYAQHVVLRRASALAAGEQVDVVTVEEASSILDVSVATVRRWCSGGELEATKAGKHWLVSAQSARKMAATRKRPTSGPSEPKFDLQKALRHVRGTDLSELWVPDILRYQDLLDSDEQLVTRADDRLNRLTFGPAVRVDVPKTTFSNRPGVLLELIDRVAYQAVVAAIAPSVDGVLDSNVYSSRLSSGTKYFLEHGTKRWVRFKKAVRESIKGRGGEVWVASVDISSYFEHVIHNTLFEELSEIGISGQPLRALRVQLSRWALVPGIGLPQGPNASRVLGNFYLGHVDRAMAGPHYEYFRYMDDVRIVSDSKPAAVAALRDFERLCRARGLTVSSAKTSVKTSKSYLRDEDDSELDEAAYFFKHMPLEMSRKKLKKILRSALTGEKISERKARFSVWRLARIREHDTLPLVIRKLEHLAPLASAVAAYLKHFTARKTVVKGLTEFMNDPSRSYSPYLRTWIYAAMLEGVSLPVEWGRRAAQDSMDRNNPTYLRAVAICVVGKHRSHSDLQWIRDELDREHDPTMMRALLVALAYADALTKAVANRATDRFPELHLTVSWLRSRRTLPSLLYADQDVKIH